MSRSAGTEVLCSVTAASNTAPIVVTTSTPLALDGDELKIAGVVGNEAANGAFYVKAMNQSNTKFALYSDKQLTSPVAGTGDYQSGGAIYRPLPEDYAIVVGINRYPAFNPLRGPEADALLFCKWLTSPTGGMVALSNVRRILSSDYDPPEPNDPSTWQPALDALKGTFWKYSTRAFENDKRIGDARVGRRLWVFLSGHGITPGQTSSQDLDGAALLAASASVDRYGEHLTAYSWIQWFKNAAAFDEIVLFLDCCRDLKNNVPPIPCTLTKLIKDRSSEVRMFYAAATELDSQSWEDPLGNPPEYHGYFSYALLETLQNDALLDTQGRLTAGQIVQQLKQLKKIVPTLRKDQNPRFIPEIPPEIILRQTQTALPPNLLVNFDPALAGQQVNLFRGEDLNQPIDTHTVNGGTWSLRVDPFKMYLLRSSSGKEQPVVMHAEVVKNVQFF